MWVGVVVGVAVDEVIAVLLTAGDLLDFVGETFRWFRVSSRSCEVAYNLRLSLTKERQYHHPHHRIISSNISPTHRSVSLSLSLNNANGSALTF